MFSKSLFKQSCKANGVMWCVITLAVCFMLACVMLIAGGSNLSGTATVIMDTIIEGELKSGAQSRSINYYLISDAALGHFDETFRAEAVKAADGSEAKRAATEAYLAALEAGRTSEEAKQAAQLAGLQAGAATAYKVSVAELFGYADSLAQAKGYASDSDEALEIKGLIFYVLNPATETGGYLYDDFYTNLGEEAPRYELTTLFTATEEGRAGYRNEYAAKNSLVFLAGNMIDEKNVQSALAALGSYGVTREQYAKFGFTDYANVKEIALSSLLEFRAKYDYRIANLKEGETAESVAEELAKDISQGFLASLPEEVSDALEEIGQADMYGVLVGSIFFKMAGLLLPIIYMIMAANNLVAGQVDSGSMAYILSSSVKRRTVTFTQAVFLVGSLFLMFCCTYITSVVCFSLVDVVTELTYTKLLLINIGAFLVMFAMSGISFLASCWFNRSKRSMALGGGLNMFFLVATMLGLFGSPVLPSIVRMKALDSFNYVSIISLFDVVSILDGTWGFVWKLAVLLVVGVVCYVIGSIRFRRKDLPL